MELENIKDKIMKRILRIMIFMLLIMIALTTISYSARLPVPHSVSSMDDALWGTVLNEFLKVGHYYNDSNTSDANNGHLQDNDVNITGGKILGISEVNSISYKVGANTGKNGTLIIEGDPNKVTLTLRGGLIIDVNVEANDVNTTSHKWTAL